MGDALRRAAKVKKVNKVTLAQLVLRYVYYMNKKATDTRSLYACFNT